MNDERKSKRQLINELSEMRGRVAELEASLSKSNGEATAVSESQSKYRTLLENLPQRIFYKNTESVYVSCNQNLAGDLGIAAEELPGKTDYDFFPKELAEKYRSDDRHIVETGQTEEIEETYVQDGNQIVVQTVKTPVRNQQGEIVGILGIFWDVTERKKAEDELSRHREHLEEIVEKRTAELRETNEQLRREIAERRSAERSLSDERNLLRTLIDNLPDNIYIKDTKSRFVLANSADARHMGVRTSDELIGKTDFDFYPKESARQFQADERKVMESGQPILNEETVCIDREGKKRAFLTTKVPLQNGEGDIVGLIGTGRDITQQKSAEEALSAERNLLRNLIDNVPDHVYVKDLDSRFLLANVALARHMGIEPPDELIGKTDFDFYPQEMACGFRKDERRVIETGEPVIHQEEASVDREGNRMWFSVAKVPLKDSEGKVTALVGSGRDITELKRVQEALEYESNLLHALMDNIPDAIYFKDARSRFLRVNKAQASALGINDPNDATGKSDLDFFNSQFAKDAYADEQQIVTTGQPLIGKVEQTRRDDGTTLWVSATKMPIKDADGRVTGLVGISRDISELRRAEEALRNSEALSHSLVESLPQNIFRKDREGRFMFANTNFCASLGEPLDNVLGKTDFDFFPPELAQKYRDDDEKLMESRQVFEDVERHQTPDGHSMFVHVIKTPVCDSEGEVIGVQGIFWDVTEQKQAEKALRDSEALYHSLVESLPLNVFRKDLTGRFTFGNRLFRDTIGKPLEEIIGKTDYDFFPKQLAEKYREDDRRVVESGEVFEDVEQHRRPDGETLYVQVLKAAVRNHAGEITGTQGIFWDVTERKRAEEALAQERYLMNSLMDNLPDNIYFKDTESRFTKINRALSRHFGLGDPREALGKTDFDFFTEDHARPAFEDEQEVMRSGRPLVAKEERETWTDGRIRWASTTKMPLRGGDGKIIGTFGVSRDITDRKFAEEELRRTTEELARSNAELEQFAYVASHDLQEPLRMVASYAQLLAKRYRSHLDADADDFIGYVVGGATRMQTLINDLLAYSRVGTRGKPLRPTNAQTALKQALDNLQIAIEDSGAVVTQDPLPEVIGDDTQLCQLFQNLLGNAIKYRGEYPPQVHVTAKRNATKWVFSVKDNGIGFEPEYAERIFVIFQRLYGATEYPGTGIGLAICKKIVERHGGSIWVESQPGKGSTFYFTMPNPGDKSS